MPARPFLLLLLLGELFEDRVEDRVGDIHPVPGLRVTIGGAGNRREQDEAGEKGHDQASGHGISWR
jgi:hypothetical protein